MNEIEEDELSSLSSESHFGDMNEPDDSDDEVVVDIDHRFEYWTGAAWLNYQQQCRYVLYQRIVIFLTRVYGHNYRLLRNEPHMIPLGGSDYAEIRYAMYHRTQTNSLLDIAALGDRVRNGIVELELYQVIQVICHPVPSYVMEVPLPLAMRMERRLDQRGFPRDQYVGRQLMTRPPNQRIGWYSLIQLCHTSPEVAMTYFLRRRPMEIRDNADWHLWTICYDMIRVQELYPNTRTPWRHFDYSDVTTENENSSTSSEETLDDI
jgi:hypothetical protein